MQIAHDSGALEAALDLSMHPQPDDTSCGPACLHAVYRYFSLESDLATIRDGVDKLWHGGTLLVYLACHALQRGLDARLYTYNLEMFDPTWFDSGKTDLAVKLCDQMAAKPHLKDLTMPYLEFLALGGELRHEVLGPKLLRGFIKRGLPVLTGLSSTYLYNTMREDPATCIDDDVAGEPAGHFVVLSGYDRETRRVVVSDPYPHHSVGENPHQYAVSFDRLVGAIFLGILTHDANLLVLNPKHTRKSRKKGK